MSTDKPQETVTISREEYDRLKWQEKILGIAEERGLSVHYFSLAPQNQRWMFHGHSAETLSDAFQRFANRG